MNKSKGFTLIELLVVIAVIGILAAVVLASLGIARNKAKDKAIISDLVQARTEIQSYFSTNGSVVGTVVQYAWSGCPSSSNIGTVSLYGVFADTRFKEIVAHAAVQSGGTAVGTGGSLTRVGCAGRQGTWVLAGFLNEKSGSNDTAWCIDSSGVSKKYTLTATAGNVNALAGTGNAVDNINYKCN